MVRPASGAIQGLYLFCIGTVASNDFKRSLNGEFRFPAFRESPNVSVEIISSAAATPLHVTTLDIAEVVGASGTTETRIVIEAKTIFDIPASGIAYANVVVTGVPVSLAAERKGLSEFVTTDSSRTRGLFSGHPIPS
jgi:hypothetical protein